MSRLIRARVASLGLVASLGFLLIVSLVVSAALAAFGNYLNAILPFGKVLLIGLNFVVSLLLITVLFAAIYKVLPDRQLQWRDVAVGAVVTAILFTIGKSLIGWYIGSSAVASSYGAAGALIVLLLWFITQFRFFCLARSSPKLMRTAMEASRRCRTHRGRTRPASPKFRLLPQGGLQDEAGWGKPDE